MSAMNDLLVATMGGAVQDYEGIIASMVVSRMGLVRNSAKFEEVVADVTSDLVISSQTGGFATSIAKAKENSTTPEELVKNMKSVFMSGVWYRIQTAIRNKKKRITTFSDLEDSVPQDNRKNESVFEVLTIDKKRGNEHHEYLSYGDMIVEELEVMATAAEWINKNRLARRYRLAKEMVPGRLAGKSMLELKDEFSVKSRATMQDIFHDMQRAMSSVAKKTQNDILLRGTASVE